MRRDWDLIRTILLRVEESSSGKEVSSNELKSADEGAVAYNMLLLIKAGLAEGGGRDDTVPNALPYAFIHRLTWAGHELLDGIRGDTVWNRIKATAKEKGVDLTFDAIKVIAKIVIEGLLRG